MLARLFLAAVTVIVFVSEASGEAARAPAASPPAASAWRSIGDDSDAPGEQAGAAGATTTAEDKTGKTEKSTASAAAEAPRQPIARVTSGSGTLPNDHGQVWREYDVSPYTLRVTTTQRPEQAIVDWILRETGYEAWHSEPLGILSASPRTLRVYHTPEMQAVVADLVDRFVSSEANTYTFGLRVVTLDQPNWRARAQRLLRPVTVQTPGTAAWLLEREDAAVLLADLRRRSDYREHSSPHLLVNNGQSTLVSAVRGRSFTREVVMRGDVWPGYEAQQGQVDEGFSLQFSPLLSVDRRLVDATIKCDIDQVEKMIPVMIDAPTAQAPRQRAKIEVPQMTHFRYHERFRWPVGQVLLIGMGTVALPVPVDAKPVVPILPLGTLPPRADLLVFVECRGQVNQAARTNPAAPQREAKTYHGRY